MSATERKTRQVTITGDTSPVDVVGLRVRVHSQELGPLVGVVESLEATRPIVRFGNSRWMYGEARLAVLVDQSTPLSSPPCSPHEGCEDCGVCHACGAVLGELVPTIPCAECGAGRGQRCAASCTSDEATRYGDLDADELVRVECIACGLDTDDPTTVNTVNELLGKCPNCASTGPLRWTRAGGVVLTTDVVDGVVVEVS